MVNDGICTIFFDLDDTLVHRRPNSFDVISAFCSELGQPLTAEAERRGRRLEHRRFADPIIRERLAQLPLEEFLRGHNRQLLEVMGIVGDLDDLALRITAGYAALERQYECLPGVGATLAELRARGYRLGLITNRENLPHLYDLLDATGLRLHMEVTVAAGEVGQRKPAAGIFQVALQRAGITADQALYVGDNYWADVVGALGAGLTPVLIDPHRLFPEATCLVVERIDELLAWLP